MTDRVERIRPGRAAKQTGQDGNCSADALDAQLRAAVWPEFESSTLLAARIVRCLTGGHAKNRNSAIPKAAIQSIDLSFIACSHCPGTVKPSSTALKLTAERRGCCLRSGLLAQGLGLQPLLDWGISHKVSLRPADLGSLKPWLFACSRSPRFHLAKGSETRADAQTMQGERHPETSLLSRHN